MLSQRWLLAFCFALIATCASAAPRWWKGNLHTHTFWSDGDEFPEMVIDWYKTNGYHFLGLSDHNVFQDKRAPRNLSDRRIERALPAYTRRFGSNWVELGQTNGKPVVWLKTFEQFQPLFNEPGKFVLIRSEEITDNAPGRVPVHLIASNLREFIKPRGGSNVVEVMQANVDAVHEQRQRTGVPMIAHIAHPNFHYAIRAEELVQLRGDRFFEVYNGHSDVRNAGDHFHASTDRMWDIINTQKVAERGEPPMFGVAVDDSHHYYTFSPSNSNSGRGWVEVRSSQLSSDSIILALEAGDFYASTGVKLHDIRFDGKRLSIEIQLERGVTYQTEFIGTRAGYDRSSRDVIGTNGRPMRVTRNYSKDVGATLARSTNRSPRYTLRGDELYVRAKITSSRVKANGVVKDEKECAWTQPVVSSALKR